MWSRQCRRLRASTRSWSQRLWRSWSRSSSSAATRRPPECAASSPMTPASPASIRPQRPRSVSFMFATARSFVPASRWSPCRSRRGWTAWAASWSSSPTRTSELARQIELTAQTSVAETAALDQQRASLAASIASLERQRGLAADQVTLAQSAVRRATGLARQGAGSQRQVEEARSTLLSRRADAESLGERIIAQRAALRNAESQGAQRADRSEPNPLGAARPAGCARRAAGRADADRPAPADCADRRRGQRYRHRGRSACTYGSIPGDDHPAEQQARNLALCALARGRRDPGRGSGCVCCSMPSPISNMAPAGGRSPRSHVCRPSLAISIPASASRSRSSASASGSTNCRPALPVERRNLRPGMTLGANLVLETRSLWQVLFGPIFGSVSR